jgi:hypothetical protein
MDDRVLLGRDRRILEFPQTIWKEDLSQVPQHSQSRLSFMTEAHQRVRNFVVQALIRSQKPVSPEFISNALDIPWVQLSSILDELERKLFFLVRDEQGAVAWAYPVTVQTTPHRLVFRSGERLYAA